MSFVNIATTTNAIPNISLLAGNATITGSGALSKTQTGYTGTVGYINFTGEGQAAWTTSIGTAATYTAKVRYAMTGTNRVMDVYVDNVKKTSITFTATTNLNTWSTKSVSLSLTKGSHTISLKTTGASGPNIDTNTLSTTATTSSTTTSVYYVHNDHKSTPQVVTNQAKAVVFMADYQPFGKLVAGQTNSIELYSRFPGQSLDSETGLYYNYFRDYDPSIGRYIESDPIGLDGGINTYAYANGNPISFTDPLGLEGVGWWNDGSRPPEPMTMTPCEKEAYVDFLVNLSSFGAYADLAADAVGLEFNFYGDSDGIELGDYDAETPFAASGHAINHVAGQYAASAQKMRDRAGRGRPHYSTRNGRLNAAKKKALTASSLTKVAKFLGPAGAMAEYIRAMEDCKCGGK